MILLRMFTRKWILTTLLVILGAGVCVALGRWQLDRLAARRIFNAHVFGVQVMPPLDLPSPIDLTTMEWRSVHATGSYDFTNQVALRDQYNGDQYGFHLLTPFRLADGETILVDRGWIPSEGNSKPADWRKYDQTGAVTVSGIIRLEQTQPSLGSATDPTLTPSQTGLDFWIYTNLDRIQKQIPYPILTVYIQLDPEPNRTDPPIPFQPQLDLTEGPHQSYALQWFTFATLLVSGYPFYIHRQESKIKK
jgi:surfeit locus 1 family protein